MGLDFDAIKRRLDRLSGNNSNRSTSFKPEEGKSTQVRLLSFPDNDGQPFKELMFYYNVPGQRGLLAPSQFGKQDPFQELINKLSEAGGQESYEMKKKLYPKMRVYAPVIVRGEEEKGVQVWSFGKLVYQQLLTYMMDEDYADITDPNNGTDITVTVTKPPGQQWAKTEIIPRRKSSKLGTNEQIKEWTTDMPDPTKMFTLKSYEELSTIINNWLSGDEAETSEGTEHGSAPADEKAETKDYSGDIDSAFKDLMK
tara:strand:- start:1464 stop:2228 length:765 start_codon:yes stop_codon:yes gene_type:complete